MLSIRTQDRMALVPYDKPIMIRDDGALFLIDSDGKPFVKLAQYATKERALEVLDEIQDNIEKTTKTYITPRNDMKQHTYNLVYQMPKE